MFSLGVAYRIKQEILALVFIDPDFCLPDGCHNTSDGAIITFGQSPQVEHTGWSQNVIQQD